MENNKKDKTPNAGYITELANNTSYPDIVRFLFLCSATENIFNYEKEKHCKNSKFDDIKSYRALLLHGNKVDNGVTKVDKDTFDYSNLNRTANKTLKQLLVDCFHLDCVINEFAFDKTNLFYEPQQLIKLANDTTDDKVKFILYYIVFSSHLEMKCSSFEDERFRIVNFVDCHFNKLRHAVNLSKFGIKARDWNGNIIPLDGEINKTIVKKKQEKEDYPIKSTDKAEDLCESYDNRKQIYLNLVLRGNTEHDQNQKMKALLLTIYQIRSNLCHGEKLVRQDDTTISERDAALIADSVPTLRELAEFIVCAL